jgi:hypothetical protein
MLIQCKRVVAEPYVPFYEQPAKHIQSKNSATQKQLVKSGFSRREDASRRARLDWFVADSTGG